MAQGAGGGNPSDAAKRAGLIALERTHDVGASVISQRMLTLTLRGLERDGLVTRTVHPTLPPGVEYALTPLGQTLPEPVDALSKWARKNRHSIQAARERFDGARARSG